MTVDLHAFSLAIRWLHVGAMAIAFGGAALIAAATTTTSLGAPAIAAIAMTYERAFWAAAGILVMTGVGNAAAFGGDLPSPASSWGATFVTKLVGVAALLLLSVPRTTLVVWAAAPGGTARTAALRWLYGATAGTLAAILAVAMWLARA